VREDDVDVVALGLSPSVTKRMLVVRGTRHATRLRKRYIPANNDAHAPGLHDVKLTHDEPVDLLHFGARDPATW